MRQPIISQAVFDSLDRNKDGFVSKGELKLKLKTDMSMKELGELIDELDANSDGKLTFDEVKAITTETYKRSSQGKKGGGGGDPAAARKKSISKR